MNYHCHEHNTYCSQEFGIIWLVLTNSNATWIIITWNVAYVLIMHDILSILGILHCKSWKIILLSILFDQLVQIGSFGSNLSYLDQVQLSSIKPLSRIYFFSDEFDPLQRKTHSICKWHICSTMLELSMIVLTVTLCRLSGEETLHCTTTLNISDTSDTKFR